MKINVACEGHACGEDSDVLGPQNTGGDEWCEVLLSQHVPQGAYIDVDEVKVSKQGTFFLL